MNEWSDVEIALKSLDHILLAIGNLAAWDVETDVYVTTLLRSVGSVASQLTVLASLGYVALCRDGQNSTVKITRAGIESVRGVAK